ncbi:MAG: glycosyltransferase family 4 protein [Desulfurococcales archaeon]|nr:glycosyltransferase family 4 protein [Desulfurococcales archaeon]
MMKALYVGNLKSSFQRDLYKYLKKYGPSYGLFFDCSYFYKSGNWISYPKLLIDMIRTYYKAIVSKAVLVEFLTGHAYYLSKLNKPLFTRAHRFDVVECKSIKCINRLRTIVNNSTKIICVSNYIRNELTKLVPESADKSIVIYNSVDTDKFKPINVKKERTFTIGYVGSLIPRKGVKELLLVFNELLREGLELQLWIGGKGPLMNYLVKLSNKLGIKDKVRFFGFIPDNELPLWYNKLDLFVLNSKSEGLPTVILEAMASGIPVIATDVGGTSEALGSEWVYPVGNNDVLKEMIRRIYSMSEDKRKLVGRINRSKTLDKFDIKENTRKIIEVVRNNI